MLKEIIHQGAPAGSAHYSAAIRDGNVLYVSGQLPLNPATREFYQGDAKEQTLRALENVEKLARMEGGDRNSIIRTTAYVKDIELWEDVNQAYTEFFGNYRPARTIVAVSAIHFGFCVEIEAIIKLN